MESTLSLTRAQLKAQTGFFLGYGLDPDGWDDDQLSVINFSVNSGCRRFFYPIQPSGGFYDWSFLRPTTTQILPSGSQTLNLPDDYGGIQGPLTVTTSGSETGSVWWPVQMTHEANVRQLYAALPSATGRPVSACEVPGKVLTGQQGQRFSLLVYPEADQEYILQFTYTVLVDALTDQAPLPYGGMQHAETLLESCLAVAEQRLDDTMQVHEAKFKELLSASMKQDMRHKPQNLGPNLDRSDGYNQNWMGYRPLSPIAVNGITY